MKKIFRLFLLFVPLLLAGQLTKAQDSLTTTGLAGKWQLFSATDVSGQILEQLIDTSAFISFSDSMRFENQLPGEQVAVTGIWTIGDTTILLAYDLKPYQSSIDSMAYTVENNQAAMIFFRNGQEVTRIQGGTLQDSRVVKQLTVDKLTQDTLIFTENGITYAYNKPFEVADKQPMPFEFSLTSILRGFLGLLVIIAIAYVFSTNRKAVSWRVVGIGLGIQILLAVGILKVPLVQDMFEMVSKMFVVVLEFTKVGSEFLLGRLANPDSFGFIFAFQVLPTIIFFSALTSLFFYLGIIQKIVYGLAWVMTRLLRLSGAESLSVAGNIFLGQTESPLLIKAYLEKMNRSEIMLVMTGGMATLAGGVLASYIAFLGGSDPVMRMYFANHLLAASVMAAPGAVVISKIIVPQTDGINKNIEITQDKIGSNALDAISNGTGEGLKLAVNVAAMLLVFLALIEMINFILLKIGGWVHLNGVIAEATNQQYSELSLEFILGYIFAPIVWVMGVVKEDITLVGQLVGQKLILTEFVAYINLADLKESGDLAFGKFTSEKSIIMSTYALCGFANFASIGIQIGGIGSLAPKKRRTLSELGMRSLLAGTLASLVSATIVGMIIG